MNQKLIQKAIEMRKFSYAPFSKYKVGSSVEAKNGNIIGGCNIESSSYGLTCCAERIALYTAIAKGYTDFISLAVATENGGFPCGACRQVIWELCGNIPIYICNKNGVLETVYSADLLPKAFDSKFLK